MGSNLRITLVSSVLEEKAFHQILLLLLISHHPGFAMEDGA
jgi:hypothetical protein